MQKNVPPSLKPFPYANIMSPDSDQVWHCRAALTMCNIGPVESSAQPLHSQLRVKHHWMLPPSFGVFAMRTPTQGGQTLALLLTQC